MNDAIGSLLSIIFLLVSAYILIAIPYAYIKPWYLKLTKGKMFAEKIIKHNLKLKNFFKKRNLKYTEEKLKAYIKKNFDLDSNFKGLFGLSFCFKELKDFTYTFHIKKNDILIVCTSFNDFYGYTIDFFVKGKNYEVRQEEVKNTVDYLISASAKHKHWGVSGKLSYTAKSFANNLLKNNEYEFLI